MRISYTSLQSIATSQELVLRFLKEGEDRHPKTEAIRDAEKVMQSLDRMVEEHPTHSTFISNHD